MIRKITAENYKCFSQQSFPLAPLTVLTGENAGGKSSLLQVLALSQQSWLEQPLDRGLLVNGAELKLGKCEDILNKQADSDVIAFELETDAVFLRLEFSAKDSEASVAPFHSGPRIKTAPDWKERELPEPLHGHGNRFNEAVLQEFPALLALRDRLYGLQYITADRIGPREIHDINYSGAYKTVGLRGERAVWFLNKYRKITVPDGRRHKGQPPVLDKQVEAWMAEIFPGFQFAVTPVPGTDLATLGLATEGNPELIRPQNTGFGLSYTLPIFVACLAAPENGLVLIENPEAHLHPAAQSKFAAFLAGIVSSGVQIIIETHSDHIINGVRKAVRAKVINKQNALIYFFRQAESSEQAKITHIEIDRKGNLTNWPKGFFDQLDVEIAGEDAGSISLEQSKFSWSPIKVLLSQSDEAIIDNVYTLHSLKHRLDGLLPPISSWSVLLERVEHLPDVTLEPDVKTRLITNPFSQNVAEGIYSRTKELSEMATTTSREQFNELFDKYATGAKAKFSDSSLSEKRDFKNVLTFSIDNEQRLCPYHGKVKIQQYRIHLVNRPAYERSARIAYIGPKLTKK